MSLQEWERDVRNRQRNIVFPDTVLNEGRFYRNIASGKAVYTLGQRISLLIVLGYVMAVTSVMLASVIGEFLAEGDYRRGSFALLSSLYLLGTLLFWIFLAVKGLLPAAPVRKRRRGYRQSGRV